MAEASETSAAYLRVLKMYEARDEYRRKFHEEKELKKLEAKFSNLNNADDGVIVDDSKQIKKGFTEEQMRLPKFELACKDELGPPEVSAHGIPMDYLTPGPWFTEAPKAAFCTTW
ncbi:hypothetical protein MKW94_023427 [Papaver nudicaule]|uniref:Uncharacterized protein n=1 Tax=Papaver nudicaule TaxID=74823 RepID=A0AA42AZ38_PAPNU|nr:hypothetical protein [Papaver nudicaule]